MVIPEKYMYLMGDFNRAQNELGETEYNKHLTMIFGMPVLNFAKTMVINLPRTCYANCAYCIDKGLRHNEIDVERFLKVVERTCQEFHEINEISITGGSLFADEFNKLIEILDSYYPDSVITWNTNGIMLNADFDVSRIKFINLHRNSVDDTENRKVFYSTKPILTINEAKELFGEKLYLRVTVDTNFDIDNYVSLGVPMYINRMLPSTEETNDVFTQTLNKLKISDNVNLRRRNQYLNCTYRNVPVRVCMGDTWATRVPGRYPIYLNVVIVHRSGKVCGSWYEDDKLLYQI